jgi:hypothetical protein
LETATCELLRHGGHSDRPAQVRVFRSGLTKGHARLIRILRLLPVGRQSWCVNRHQRDLAYQFQIYARTSATDPAPERGSRRRSQPFPSPRRGCGWLSARRSHPRTFHLVDERLASDRRARIHSGNTRSWLGIATDVPPGVYRRKVVEWEQLLGIGEQRDEARELIRSMTPPSCSSSLRWPRGHPLW